MNIMNSKFKQYKTKHADLFSIICLLFVCTLFLSPYLFSIPTPLIYPVSDLGTDLDREVLPNIEYVVDYYKSTGQIPLWRPYQLSGAPVIGHPTFPIFYPLYWLFLIIPKPIGLNLLALFNIFFLGVGMYMYLRNGGKNKPFPSLIGAIVMAISPKWIAHLSGGHWFMLSALAFTPWAIFALDQFWKTRLITWLRLLSLFLSAQAMNHQPIFAITCILLVLLSALYLSKVNWKSWLILMPWGGMLVSAITFSLSAVTILPLLKLIPHSVKAINTSTFTSLNPAALIVSLIPPEFKYPEWFLYPGLIVIIFSGLSWAYGWTNFEKKWAAVGLLGCVLSLGEFTPIYNGLFGWNLLISVLRVPTRWWLMTLLALTILATSGFSLWLRITSD